MMAKVYVDKLLMTAINLKATDLILVAGRPPIATVSGGEFAIPTKPLTADVTAAVAEAMLPNEARSQLDKVGWADGDFDFRDNARFHVLVDRVAGNVTLRIRPIIG